MSDYSAGSISFDLKLNSNQFSNEVKQESHSAEKTVKSSLADVAATHGKTINQMKSEIMKLAHVYKKEGLEWKAAVQKAYSEMGVVAQKATVKIKNSAKQSMSDNISNSFKSFSSERIASNAGDKISSSIKRIGAAVIAAFSVSAIKNFGQNLIEQAAKVNASNAQFTQTFKSLESEARASISEVAKESGILETRLQGTGSQLYAFAKASGMDSADALNMMKTALKTAADSAAYYDRSLEDTAESLRSFLKGNYANDAALGVSATETTRNAAANRLYGQSFMELSEAQKQLVLLDMVQQANAASGAMGQAARESEGWENVVGNLKEAWNQLLAAIGRPILQGAIAVIKRLTEWITTLAQWAKAASQALGELFGWNTDTTEQTAVNTAQTANSIAESVDNQNALTQAVAKTNAEVKRGVANFDKLNIIFYRAAAT